MINIQSDLPIRFEPTDPFFDMLAEEGSDRRLYKAIEDYLHKQGVFAGFRLGRIGDHEEVSLFESDGYWIVAYSERGSTDFIGIFHSELDATEFFISYMTRNDDCKTIDWKVI